MQAVRPRTPSAGHLDQVDLLRLLTFSAVIAVHSIDLQLGRAEVGNGRGPGRELGSHGMGASVYVFDPNQHLIEIRHYDDDAVTAPV